MVEVEETEVQLPLESVGARLMRAREAAGLSRSQVAGMTRIPDRHLAAIEANDFAALPARTYAIGFSRSYAKAVGLNPEETVNAVREELAIQEPSEPRRTMQTFEPGDPARVPSSRLVWVAVIGILAVLAAGFMLVRSMFAPGANLPSIVANESPAPAASEAATAPAASGGAVVFTATEPKVWVKFTDAAGNQLFQKELSQGESWTLPGNQADVRLATARPDALSITVGGQAVPKLSDVQKSVRDVPVSAADLLARGAAASGPEAAVPAGPALSAAAPPRPRASAPARTRERNGSSTAQSPVRQPASGPAPAAVSTPSDPVPAAAGPAPQPSAT